MSKERTLDDLKEYHRNPRKISEGDFTLLGSTIEKYGDISGIVFNIRSGELVGGHRRSDVFRSEGALIHITQRYDKPTPVGTVAMGYIEYKGERYSYREVDWDEETAGGANIAANKVGGMWDFDKLANDFEMKTLLENGFKEHEFYGKGQANGGEKDLSAGAETQHECPKCHYKF